MDFAPLVLKMDFKDAVAMRKALEATGISAEKVEKAIEKMTRGTTEGMKKSLTQFEQFQKKLESISNGLNKFENGFNMYITLPLIAAGTAAVKMSNDLNKGMASVATLIPEQANKIGEYKEAIKDLSIETGKSFNDLTRGLYETISAFPGVQDAVGVTEVATKAARAGLSTTKEALDLLSATTKAYGDTSLDAQKKVADLAFTAVKLGQTTFPEMASAIQTVTERSAALGVSQEELFSVFGTFTGVTGDAAMAATQMRSALIAVSNPTQELQQVFQKLGVSGSKAAKELIAREGLQGAFQQIVDTADEMDFSIQKVFRRIEGVTFAGQLVGPLAEKFKQLEEATEDASGAMIEAFEIQTQGVNEVGFAMEQAFRAGQVALSELGDTMAPFVFDAAVGLKNLAQSFREMGDTSKRVLVGMGKDVVVFGIILKAVSSLTKSVTVLIPLLVKLSGALTAALGFSATGPLGLLAAVATAGVVTFKIVSERREQARIASVDPDTREGVSDRIIADAFKTFFEGQASILQESGATLYGGGDVERALDYMIPGESIRTVDPEAMERFKVATEETKNLIAEIARESNATKLEVIGWFQSSDKISSKYKEQLDIIEEQLLIQKELGSQWSQYVRARLDEERKINESQAARLEALSAMDKERARLEGYAETSEELVSNNRMSELDRWKFLAEETKKILDDYIEIQLATGSLNEDQLKWVDELLRLYNDRQAMVDKLSGSGDGLGDANALKQWQDAIKQYEKLVQIGERSVKLGLTTGLEDAQAEVERLSNLINTGLQLGRPDEDLQPFIDKLKEAKQGLRDLNEAEIWGKLDSLLHPTDAMGIANLLVNPREVADQALGLERERIQLDLDLAIDNGDIDKVKALQGELRTLDAVAVGLNGVFELLSLSISTLAEGFFEFGRAAGQSAALGESNAEAAERQAAAFDDLLLSLIKSLPQLMANVGVQLLGTLNPAAMAIGLALLAGSAAINFSLGAMEGYNESYSGNSNSHDPTATVHNAKGGIYGFANGGAFTNSIVDTPTLFKFAKGAGLMGEAGPEAIMPLTRTSDGKLGVKAEGAGTNVIVNVINKVDGTTVSRQERTNSNNMKEIDIIIEKKILGVLGSGKADGTMRSRYGVSTKPYR